MENFGVICTMPRKVECSSPIITRKRKRNASSRESEELFCSEEDEDNFFCNSNLNSVLYCRRDATGGDEGHIPSGQCINGNSDFFYASNVDAHTNGEGPIQMQYEPALFESQPVAGFHRNNNTSFFSNSTLELLLGYDNSARQNEAHYEPALFQTQHDISLQKNNISNDDTFFSKSTIDILLDNCGTAKQTQTLQQNQTDQSLLTVSTLESLINDTSKVLFGSRSENNSSIKMEDSKPVHLSPNSVSHQVDRIKNSPLFCSETNNNFNDGNKEDSLFNTINLPAAIKDDESQKLLRFDNTFFANIHLDNVIVDEQDEFQYTDSDQNKQEVQNTQKFLEDIAKVKASKVDSICSEPQAGSPFGQTTAFTQYAVHEEKHNSLIVSDLSRLNWESQAFTLPVARKVDFYGLPLKVKHLIFEHKRINSLYEWQDECLNLPAVHNRKNLIYALPTSGGKTLVAEILMLREVLCHKKDVLFILPYVSIVQEKVSAMSPFAIALNFIVDEYAAGKGKCPPMKRKKRNTIFVASIEKGAILMDSLIDAHRAEEIGLVVVDELHLIGEQGRGATLEALLTKIMFLNVSIQIVGMSATIGNLSEISTFLKADVYTRSFRPVELKEYIKCGNDILEINANGKTLEETFLFKRSVDFKYSESVARSDPDHLAGLVAECAPENSCLVFCHTRKNCENVALLLSRILPKSKFLEHRKREKTDLMDALDKVCGVLSNTLAETIPFGIAYHHSGLTMDERKFIEAAYRYGVLSVICCTSTLAAGVNLPAKRVIIRAPYVGQEFMSLCRYKQMVGRAGRAGMGEAGESILIASSRDNVRVSEMLFSPMDKALSSLHYDNCLGLQGLILSTIGLEIATCRSDLYQLVNGTLLAVQAERLNISVEDVVYKIVSEMVKDKVLEYAKTTDQCGNGDIRATQEGHTSAAAVTTKQRTRKNFISKTTRFQLTKIGKAAFKAGIDYKRAFAVHSELSFAQKSLILTNFAHLLYLVISFSSNSVGDEMFPANASILYREHMKLDETTQSLFRLMGFTEALAVKIAKTLSIQGAMELRLNRLYKVLVLMDIINIVPLPAVAAKYNVERGVLQTLINQSIAAANAIVRLCEQLDEFWCFKPLFERISIMMERCGTIELQPLLDLPAVKVNRAKQLYTAGFKTVEDIAKCRPIDLVHCIEHMPMKIAKEIVSAAKIIIMKKLDYLEEETEALKLCLQRDDNQIAAQFTTE